MPACRAKQDYFLRMFFVVLVATLYGISDEWHQGFVHGRDASGFDVLADAAGALLVSVFLFRWPAPSARWSKHARIHGFIWY